MTEKRPYFGPRKNPLAALRRPLVVTWAVVWRIALGGALVYGLFWLTQLDVSRLTARAAARQPVGEGADLVLYDDGKMFLRAHATVVRVEENEDIIEAQGLSAGELFDDDGRRRVAFAADTLIWRKSLGQVVMEGGITLSASEGDVLKAPQLLMNRTEQKIFFHQGLKWRAGRSHLSAGEAEADRKLQLFSLRGTVEGEIFDLRSLALSRSQRTFKKRQLSPGEVLPLRVLAPQATVDQTQGLATFTSAPGEPPLLLSLKRHRLRARTAQAYTREKRLEVSGETQLVRPSAREKRFGDTANAFAQDKAVISTAQFTWFYGEKRMIFPTPLVVVQPARVLSAGQGILDDAAGKMDLTAGVGYQQTHGPWAKRLKKYDDLSQDARDILTGPMALRSGQLSYDLKNGAFEALGGVEVRVKARTLTGHRAVYVPHEKKWTMQGAVVYRQKDNQAVFTELFTLKTDVEQAVLEGRSRVLINPSERMKSSYDDMAKDPLWR